MKSLSCLAKGILANDFSDGHLHAYFQSLHAFSKLLCKGSEDSLYRALFVAFGKMHPASEQVIEKIMPIYFAPTR